MKKKIALILALALVFLMSASVFATMTAGGTSGVGNATRDGSVNGGMGTGGDGTLTDGTTSGAVDGSGPVNDTAGGGGSWVGIVIAIIVAAVLIAVVVAILPRRR